MRAVREPSRTQLSNRDAARSWVDVFATGSSDGHTGEELLGFALGSESARFSRW
jgi:hypothetical protein